MDIDNLNLEIRKFLKKVGISSQRIIETSITDEYKNRAIDIGDEIELEMKLSIISLNNEHIIKEKIKIK
ncbi:DUF6494 family protein [Pelagibacteraceae bacterium]|nr:DUF6494 family protein [Pelagibacteraceae bacterium]MDC2992148.1 DUF6494 family protein [Pelagibacteraceae bacterium]